MEKTFNDYVAVYKEQLAKGDIQIAYELLIKYVMELRTQMSKQNDYKVGNVLRGYMDITYFPFLNEFLKERKLRFGIVLNHREMQFELWLMGQNAEIQNEYWNKLKNTKWNCQRKEKPQYSVLEAILVAQPNFDDLDTLTKSIQQNCMEEVQQIMLCLE